MTARAEAAARPDLTAALLDETARLVTTPSVSGDEGAIAEYVERTLRDLDHLTVNRIGNTVVGRYVPSGHCGATGRLLLAGHLDTVPPVDPPQPVRRERDEVTGRGAVDMKGGVAVLLLLAGHALPGSRLACTIVLYEREELGSHGSGMRTLADAHPQLLAADAGILLEPTGGWVEPGCQGSLRVRVTYRGRAAHTARPWQGVNAIHRASTGLRRCAEWPVPEIRAGGFTYPQALEVVAVSAGQGGNTVPDRCEIEVNARYAPTRSREEVLAELSEIFTGADEVCVTLDSPAAPPRLEGGLLTPLLEHPEVRRRPKLGWTDVGRLAQLGVPAVNFGPGDPELAHGPLERVSGAELAQVYCRLAEVLR